MALMIHSNPFARHVPPPPFNGVFSGSMHSAEDGFWNFEGRFVSATELVISVRVFGETRAVNFRGRRTSLGWLLNCGPRVLRLHHDLEKGVWEEPGRPREVLELEFDEEDDDDDDEE
jgi:hypothetical protein